jgi:hypothetical protein
MTTKRKQSINPISRLLIWCSGVPVRQIDLALEEDSLLYSDTIESRRNTGGIILLTVVVAFLSTGWTVYTFTPKLILFGVVGLIVALILFFFNRAIAGAPSKKTAWLRVPIAVPISVFFALPLVLMFFDPYLAGTGEDNMQEERSERVEPLMAERDGIQASIDSLQDRGSFYRRAASAEELGYDMQDARISQAELDRWGVPNPSGNAGCGTRCEDYRYEAERADQEAEAMRAERARVDEELESARASVTAPSGDAISRLEQLVEVGQERPIMGLIALLIMLMYLVFDLMPAIQRICSNDPVLTDTGRHQTDRESMLNTLAREQHYEYLDRNRAAHRRYRNGEASVRDCGADTGINTEGGDGHDSKYRPNREDAARTAREPAPNPSSASTRSPSRQAGNGDGAAANPEAAAFEEPFLTVNPGFATEGADKRNASSTEADEEPLRLPPGIKGLLPGRHPFNGGEDV